MMEKLKIQQFYDNIGLYFGIMALSLGVIVILVIKSNKKLKRQFTYAFFLCYNSYIVKGVKTMRLNSEMRMLLDKLYNLRGEDSVVLVSMDKERDQAIKTKERTSKRTTELTSQIEKLESEGHILAKEGESFKSALETIRKDDFINVLKELNIAFDPEEIKKELEVKLPKTLEEFSMEKEKAEKELVTVEDEMNSATTKIEELGLRKDEALANQERLNRYFDLALEGNINITRDEITSLLEKFNFSEEEQREAAKLLMFPEDGLYEYQKSLKGIKSKSISDVFKEAKEEIKTEEINKETPVVEAPLHEEEPSFNFDFNINIPENKEVKEEQIEAIVEPVKEDDKTVSKEDVINLLTSLGFDYLDFTSNDFEKIMNNYDEETIKANAEYIKSLNVSLDIFADNVELMYDKQMKEKIEKLTSIGKMPQDIYLNPSVLTKYDLNGLNNAIDVLKQSGLDAKNVPLIAYQKGISYVRYSK